MCVYLFDGKVAGPAAEAATARGEEQNKQNVILPLLRQGTIYHIRAWALGENGPRKGTGFVPDRMGERE